MSNKINLDEFWNKRYPHGKLPKYAKDIIMEYSKELLELAALNATINLIEYAKYQGKIIKQEDLGQEIPTETSQIYLSCNKQSILDTINQIE